MSRNRLHNITNPAQGDYKKVLCLCSAGLLRSPSIALVLSQEPFNFNTRAAGTNQEYALIFADDILLRWADEVVCAEWEQQNWTIDRLVSLGDNKPVHNLNIGDDYDYRDKNLMKMILTQARNIFK